jgi:cold shock CspA family protein/ribosome-associated translation inhibitor RaiA
MQTLPEIQFQGMEAMPEIQEAVATHVAELEKRWGRITACRVVVKAPSDRHRKGGLYEVHIRLALPDGREVNVQRTPPKDERHADLTFAVNDAFKHARRQLQDQVQRTKGHVKHHDGPPVGTVMSLDPLGEFGFLESGDGQEIYFHRNSVLDDAFSRLTVGARVTFAEEQGDKGLQASAVKLVGKQRLHA